MYKYVLYENLLDLFNRELITVPVALNMNINHVLPKQTNKVFYVLYMKCVYTHSSPLAADKNK
jgi:hypothetical protein